MLETDQSLPPPNGESLPNLSEATSPNSARPDPSPAEVNKVFAWAAAEARRNAERAARAKPLPIGETLASVRFTPTSQEDVDRLLAKEEERKRLDKVASLLRLSGVPERYGDARLFDVDLVPADVSAEYEKRSKALAKLIERPGMVALIGNRGAGKTHMACALVRAFCEQCRPAVYCEAMDYFIALQETYGDRARQNPSQVEAHYFRPELLVLDAMEERADTVWNDRMLTRLINKRYSSEKCTVLISNEEAGKFNERVGQSIADRIRDDGGKIECRWESLRGRLGGVA